MDSFTRYIRAMTDYAAGRISSRQMEHELYLKSMANSAADAAYRVDRDREQLAEAQRYREQYEALIAKSKEVAKCAS